MKSFRREREKINYIFHRIIFLGTRFLQHGLGIFSLKIRIFFYNIFTLRISVLFKEMYVQTLPVCVLSLLLTTSNTDTSFKCFQSLSNKWTTWKSWKNSKTKERSLELEISFPQSGKPTIPLALPGTLSPDSRKQLPSSLVSQFSS